MCALKKNAIYKSTITSDNHTTMTFAAWLTGSAQEGQGRISVMLKGARILWKLMAEMVL